MAGIRAQGDDDKEEQKKIFCSEGCKSAFTGGLMRRVEEDNESALFMGDFSTVKKAASILQRYTDQLANVKGDIFARMERDANVKLLDEFWTLMAETTVEIKEKNVDLLTDPPKQEDQAKASVEGKEETKEPTVAAAPEGESWVEKGEENDERSSSEPEGR